MKKFILSALTLGPAAAFAQTVGNPGGTPNLTRVQTLMESIKGIVDFALPIVVGLALLGFFWGLMKFVFSAGNEENKEQGKHIMIYGIVGLFVMVSVWGLVNFISSNLGIGAGGQAPVPTVEGL